MGIDDNELMHLAQSGNHKAFEQLVLKYRKQAELFCNSIIKDHTTAQDIVQDVFTDIYLQRMRYRFDCGFGTYLYSVVKHKSIDYLRKKDHQQEICMEETEENSHNDTPEQIYLSHERDLQIRQLLLALKKEYRDVLYLYAVEDLSYQEIAARLNKTLPQVKILIYRARKKAVRLKEEWSNE